MTEQMEQSEQLAIKPLTIKDIFLKAYDKFIVERQLPCCTKDVSHFRMTIDGVTYRDLLGWALPDTVLDKLYDVAKAKYAAELKNHIENGEGSAAEEFAEPLEEFLPAIADVVYDYAQYFDDELRKAEEDGPKYGVLAEDLPTVAGLTRYLHDDVSAADDTGRPVWTISFKELVGRYDVAAQILGVQLPLPRNATDENSASN